ncbi:DUF6603 domain-containing protein [Streptomyces sp. NPDC005180]|uniref:DUF6603 domain-containing protein n=1 Tax=Streptomyces sp. NPDC005180 TaxID=3156868 RepID=UPI0033BB296F
MAVGVAELREWLWGDGAGGGAARLVEVPGDVLGLVDGFRPVFADGVLRAVWEEGDAQALTFTGTARTALADGPVPVGVSFSHDGGEAVTGVSLSVVLPAPGVAGEVLGRGLGIDVPSLPVTASVTRLDLQRADGVTMLTGEGEHGRVSVVSRSGTGRLMVAASGAWYAVCADRRLTADQASDLLVTATGVTVALPEDGLAEGTWLVLPEGAWPGGPLVVPVRPDRPRPELDPARRDGLGRAMPVRGSAASADPVPRVGVRRVPHAVATDEGFVLLAPGWLGAQRRAGFAFGGATDAVSLRGFIDIGKLDGKSIAIKFDKSPLRISGGLAARKADPPYTLAVGGVLLVDTGTLHGNAIAAAYAPSAGAKPSFFAFGALTADKGIGPPAFQVRGVAGGMGWRSHLRLPERAEKVADFPFIKALADPRLIGAKPDGTADPLKVLDHLTKGPKPWITPAQGSDDPLWVAVGLAFTVAECLDGRAMMAVQTGEDLTLALLGVAGMSFPKLPGRRKYAHVEIGLEALLKPKAGELSLSAALTSKSFVLDPNCRLRGGVAFKTWFGPSPNKGDFVVTVGGYHKNFRKPSHYPVVPRLGFTWDLSGTVTVSGDAYFALTPAAVMAGGGLAVRFHSGALRAWLTARVDALIQWKPFYFDVGMRVSVGVSASVKIVFVRITITIEVGVSLSVWGPPTGGEAEVHLWFISFTIGFGAKRDADTNALDWSGFRTMLPPPDTTVRVIPGAGLIADRPQSADGTLGDDDAWQVSSAGFTFSTDSAVPVGELYLTRSGGSAVELGSKLNIRPMRETNLTSVQRVSVTWHDQDGDLDLSAWIRTPATASVPQALWGTGSGNTLASPGEQVIPNQLTGAKLSSPGPQYGIDTGYIGEDALKFDLIDPDGVQPLDPDAQPVGPVPLRQDGAIGIIARTVAAPAQNSARAQLAQALTGLGLGLGALDTDLSAHADAAESAFTAEPMLVPAS